MNGDIVTLNHLPVGCLGIVKELRAEPNKRRRLLDLGLIKGTAVEAVLKSPGGDPMAFSIRGALIALRETESSEVLICLRLGRDGTNKTIYGS